VEDGGNGGDSAGGDAYARRVAQSQAHDSGLILLNRLKVAMTSYNRLRGRLRMAESNSQ